MVNQKFVKYKPLDIKGNKLETDQELTLNVLENSGNYLLHKNLLRHFNSQKQGTVSTKNRSQVRGGGKKPWKQKGTGRARAGSNRSPLWKGGGVIFGPKPKNVKFKLNKKERRLAIQTLLYNKKDKIIVIEELENQIKTPKTKQFLTICKQCNISLDHRIVLIVAQKTNELKFATKNLKNIELILASNLNIFSLLKAKQILVSSLALNHIKEIYCD